MWKTKCSQNSGFSEILYIIRGSGEEEKEGDKGKKERILQTSSHVSREMPGQLIIAAQPLSHILITFDSPFIQHTQCDFVLFQF